MCARLSQPEPTGVEVARPCDLGSAPTVPQSSLIVLPPWTTACRLRPFDLDNDTGRTYLRAKGERPCTFLAACFL